MTPCRICNGPTVTRDVPVRGGKRGTILVCEACDFHFFDRDPSASLAADHLDQTRLLQAGLEIPEVEKDFQNGRRQSERYITDFFPGGAKGLRVLDIGCSWGYFLDLVREHGGTPVGLELNVVRAEYVRRKLGIECFDTLESLEASNQRFDRIFMFYSQEYVAAPVEYFRRLTRLLGPGGEIVSITPNLGDVLLYPWGNEGYRDFFYDEHAVGYYSVRAVERLGAAAGEGCTVRVENEQGYSLLNHMSWYFTQKPRTTGMVGGDRYVADVTERLGANGPLGVKLANIVAKADADYRRTIEAEGRGNRIIFRLRRT